MNTIATGNLIAATDRDAALARSQQKPEMYDKLVARLEKLIMKRLVLSVEVRKEN